MKIELYDRTADTEDRIESVYLQRDRISQIRQVEAESYIEVYIDKEVPPWQFSKD